MSLRKLLKIAFPPVLVLVLFMLFAPGVAAENPLANWPCGPTAGTKTETLTTEYGDLIITSHYRLDGEARTVTIGLKFLASEDLTEAVHQGRIHVHGQGLLSGFTGKNLDCSDIREPLLGGVNVDFTTGEWDSEAVKTFSLEGCEWSFQYDSTIRVETPEMDRLAESPNWGPKFGGTIRCEERKYSSCDAVETVPAIGSVIPKEGTNVRIEVRTTNASKYRLVSLSNGTLLADPQDSPVFESAHMFPDTEYQVQILGVDNLWTDIGCEFSFKSETTTVVKKGELFFLIGIDTPSASGWAKTYDPLLAGGFALGPTQRVPANGVKVYLAYKDKAGNIVRIPDGKGSFIFAIAQQTADHPWMAGVRFSDIPATLDVYGNSVEGVGEYSVILENGAETKEIVVGHLPSGGKIGGEYVFDHSKEVKNLVVRFHPVIDGVERPEVILKYDHVGPEGITWNVDLGPGRTATGTIEITWGSSDNFESGHLSARIDVMEQSYQLHPRG